MECILWDRIPPTDGELQDESAFKEDSSTEALFLGHDRFQDISNETVNAKGSNSSTCMPASCDQLAWRTLPKRSSLPGTYLSLPNASLWKVGQEVRVPAQGASRKS